jgi:hypothetical protein
MPSQTQGTTRRPQSDQSTGSTSVATPHRRSFTPRENAFSAQFLDKARRREAAAEPGVGAGVGAGAGAGESLSQTELSRRAYWAGPWEVETVPAGDGVLHVVTRRAETVAAPGSRSPAARMRSWPRPRWRLSARRTI